MEPFECFRFLTVPHDLTHDLKAQKAKLASLREQMLTIGDVPEDSPEEVPIVPGVGGRSIPWQTALNSSQLSSNSCGPVFFV